MADRDPRFSPRPGVDGPLGAVTPAELAAVVVGFLWLVVSGLYLLRLPGEGGDFGPLRGVLTLLAVVLPVAMLWLAAASARSARLLRDESRRLQAAIDAMRQTHLSERQARGSAAEGPGEVERRLAEIERATRQTEQLLATLAGGVAAVAAPGDVGLAPPVEQPRLALGEQRSAAPLERVDLIRALNFPETESDRDGFAALRRALADRSARNLIQASQDVLTLMSQDGIYMDDLRPDRTRPEIWRRFAAGERGGAVSGLGGVRDRAILEPTAARMREDAIFRDAAHHFLRLFDRMLVEFEPGASDEDLARLSETRTARAFMLLGRVAGSFD